MVTMILFEFIQMFDSIQNGKICGDTLYKSFLEWAICSYEVEQLCKEQPFSCPACTPHMLAVAVDGNRKHYRFKKCGRYNLLSCF